MISWDPCRPLKGHLSLSLLINLLCRIPHGKRACRHIFSLENTGQEGHFELLKTALRSSPRDRGLKRMEILTINVPINQTTIPRSLRYYSTQRSGLADVRTAGASISCYFRVNRVNILRQAADRCKCSQHRAAPVHAQVPVQSSDPLLFAQQWHLNLRTALSFKCQVSR